MKDETPFKGGAANMPPFPRPEDRSLNETNRTSDLPPADAETNDLPPELESALPEEPIGAAPAAEGDVPPIATPRPARQDSLADDGATASGSDDFPDADDLLNDLAEERPRFEPAGPDSRIEDEHHSFRSAAAREIARRAEIAALKGMERVADTLDETAFRIHRLATLRGGPDAAAFGPVHSTVGRLEGAADYLRTSDLEGVRAGLRHRVRTQPVQTLGLALCAGWLLGRVLR